MREIEWLAQARESFLEIIARLAAADAVEAGSMVQSASDRLADAAGHAWIYPDSDIDPALQEIIVNPFCHLLYDVTETRITVVAALPSRQWWERGDFLH